MPRFSESDKVRINLFLTKQLDRAVTLLLESHNLDSSSSCKSPQANHKSSFVYQSKIMDPSLPVMPCAGLWGAVRHHCIRVFSTRNGRKAKQ